jgi:hypothetical protein
MKSEILLTLIKEVVKNEVKQQVKEEVAKLIKSGAVTLNSQKKSTPSLKDLAEVNIKPTAAAQRREVVSAVQQRPAKEFTKDPMINEILNMTQPFTAAHRVEGGVSDAGGSVLDMIKPQSRVMEEDWETMDFRDINVPDVNPAQSFQSTGDGLQDATIKALTRDYSELVKRFK